VTENERIKQERDDVAWIMDTLQGRRFMWRVLGFCGVFHDGEGSTEQILKQLGKRSVGLFLMGITTDAAQESYFTMMREADHRAIEEQIKHDNANDTTTTYDYSGIGTTPANYSTDHFDNFYDLPSSGSSDGIA
jgi:hypothetical protein